MWQISGPPATYLGFYIFGYLHDFGQIGVCHSAQNGPIWKFFNYFCTKSKLKGGLFYAKNVNLYIWGPTLLAVLDKWGCLPISPIWLYFKICQQIPVQILNWKVIQFMKKLPTCVFWAPQFLPFWTNGVSADWPKMNQFF